MSQQINLLNPAFRKAFDWLSAKPLAIATCLLLVIVGTASVVTGKQADSRERAANQRVDTLKVAQDRLLTMTKSITESKPNLQLANELANARGLLKTREEILGVLEKGALGNTIGFAEFLRGFARQAPNGLWLTGFTIGAGGTEMEIRGRMLNPASLPEYISRLKTEKVFQGRSFASLTIQRPEDGKEKTVTASPPSPTAKPASSASLQAVLPRFVDFVLMPSAPNAGTASDNNAQALSLNLVDSVQIPGANSPGKATNGSTASPAQIPEKKS